jgi:ribosomal protein L9
VEVFLQEDRQANSRLKKAQAYKNVLVIVINIFIKEQEHLSAHGSIKNHDHH